LADAADARTELQAYCWRFCSGSARAGNSSGRASAADSRLPIQKSLSAFDLKRLPGKVSAVVRTLVEGSFVDRKENVLAFGNPGSGKTHLLCGIGQELARPDGRCTSVRRTCSCRICCWPSVS